MNAEYHEMTNAEAAELAMDLARQLEAQRLVAQTFQVEAREWMGRAQYLARVNDSLRHRIAAQEAALAVANATIDRLASVSPDVADPFGLIRAANDAVGRL